MIIRFSIPDVPYGQIEINPDGENLEDLMEYALKFRAAFLDAFPPDAPRASQQLPQNNGGTRPAPAQQARPAAPPARRGTGLFCPDHGVEVLKTAPQYDKEGDRYYHPLPENEQYRLDDGRLVKNHNLYERQCVTREVVESTPF